MSGGFIAQSLPLLLWFQTVNQAVTDPYLDEVFHVRQAQNYLKGRFDVWDGKITTPPGLYLFSYLASPVLGSSLKSLRALSLFCLAAIPPVVSWTYVRRQRSIRRDLLAKHSAVNISLLPPLFFFSSLYYTDVASTLSVLIFYNYFLRCFGKAHNWTSSAVLVVLGLISLTFRQTNVFWVAIFPAALTLLNQLDQGHDIVKDSMYRRVEGFGDGMLSVAKSSWKMDVVFDPSVRDAWLEDYGKTVISIAICICKTITEPKRLIALTRALSPYLTLLSAFAGFVLWNGSVVLGDKGNHVATVHLPQMLYIWPYFAFFSWPMLYPYLSALAFGLISKLSHFASLESMLIFRRRRLMPRLWVTVVFTAVATLMVRFNTVVHPFILADNRHYVFYVFKLLMRRWWIKYAVIPIYTCCGWACVQALGARPTTVSRKESSSDGATDTAQNDQVSSRSTKDFARRQLPDGNNSAKTPFVIIWIATTTLQLVTAPLVEPRYLILPWIFWRMHIPLRQYEPAESSRPNKTSSLVTLDHRLWLETAWFLLINACTGYIFLKWGFSWPQEPGLVQRFMW